MMLFRMLILLIPVWAAAEIPVEETQKVIFFTVPKAGTHLLIKAAEKMFGQRPRWIGAERYRDVKLPRELLENKSRFFISHLFPSADYARNLDPETFKKVLLIRDPRDVMLSFLFHVIRQRAWPFNKNISAAKWNGLSFDEKLERALSVSPLTPKDSIPYAVSWSRDPNIFVIRFEDLVGAQGGGSDEAQFRVLQDLAEFVGESISPVRLQQISSTLFGGTTTFRQGKISSWEDSYSEENKELFKSLLGRETVELGYVDDFNW